MLKSTIERTVEKMLDYSEFGKATESFLKEHCIVVIIKDGDRLLTKKLIMEWWKDNG